MLGGRGRALFPRFFVESELESGKLMQAIPGCPPPELSINAVYETRRHLLPKLQAFLGFLKEHTTATGRRAPGRAGWPISPT